MDRAGLLEAAAAQADVYAQLAKNFPAPAIAWVRDASWSGPSDIDPDRIDTSHMDTWDAAKNPVKVARLRAKARRKAATGGHLKPAVLVATPGNSRLVVADGHHHVAAAMKERTPVWAYIGHVSEDSGPWDELHTKDKRGQSGTRDN